MPKFNPDALFIQIRKTVKQIRRWREQRKRVNNGYIKLALKQDIDKARKTNKERIQKLHTWLNRKSINKTLKKEVLMDG